ncbi:MAG: hypothetical protein ABSA45_05165 [Verrucomicrobiota bacterium]|jgi:hypothetical protein
MTTKKTIAIGCGAVLLIGIILVVAVVLFFVHVSKDIEGVVVSVNGPTDVTVGQTFELEVVVRNERASKVLRLSDVDLADQYLAGFTVSSVKPTAKSSKHVPIDNAQSFTFDVPIAAGSSNRFIFTLRAENAGMYRGDVDIWEGMRCITTMAQTAVGEKK